MQNFIESDPLLFKDFIVSRAQSPKKLQNNINLKITLRLDDSKCLENNH